MPQQDVAERLIVESEREERRAKAIRRRVRRAEPRITDPATHPRRYVSLAVAAEYLEIDRKTLNIYLLDRKLAFQQLPHRRRVEVAELVAFKQRTTVERKAG